MMTTVTTPDNSPDDSLDSSRCFVDKKHSDRPKLEKLLDEKPRPVPTTNSDSRSTDSSSEKLRLRDRQKPELTTTSWLDSSSRFDGRSLDSSMLILLVDSLDLLFLSTTLTRLMTSTPSLPRMWL